MNLCFYFDFVDLSFHFDFIDLGSRFDFIDLGSRFDFIDLLIEVFDIYFFFLFTYLRVWS